MADPDYKLKLPKELPGGLCADPAGNGWNIFGEGISAFIFADRDDNGQCIYRANVIATGPYDDGLLRRCVPGRYDPKTGEVVRDIRSQSEFEQLIEQLFHAKECFFTADVLD
ncbi:hypothetical protein KY328_06000 [Candidatus Woesearchaeota archaeon]|nr:hypothetical protein [Candidatus Woesearchaeota archaeon]